MFPEFRYLILYDNYRHQNKKPFVTLVNFYFN